MDQTHKRVKKPHCYLVYALAPESLPAAEATRRLERRRQATRRPSASLRALIGQTE